MSPLENGRGRMKVDSLTNLVKDTGISLNAATLLAAIIKTPLAETVEYISTSGSGEIKKFVRLTDAGLKFGINRPGIHEFKTEVRFYAHTFRDFLDVIHQHIGDEISGLADRKI